jgi:Ca-activated chloride channel family protein
MMVQPPRRVELEQVPPREYLFVMDVSGSMNGFPIETAKRLVRDLIGDLRPTDSFNVLTFAGGSDLWSEHSLPATQANVQAAIAMLERQQGGGGTELLAALRRAMELPRESEPRARSIVLVTDGYISAEADVFEYVRNHLDRANVFTFGIGSSVNRHLLEGVARAGLGEPFVVSDAAHAPAAAARFRKYVQYPLLTGVHVAFEGFDAYDVTPSILPDVLAERPILLQGKWRGSPAGRVVITGTTGAGHFERALDVAASQPDEANRALRELWARTTVAELADWGGEPHPDGVRRKIVRLGLAYDLLTRYTSFVAVHEVVVNPSGDGVAVAQPLPLPQGVSDLAVGGVAVGDEPGLLWLAAGIFLASLLLASGSRARLAASRS